MTAAATSAGSPVDPTNLPLRDIHLPAPVSWWPPAPGWWALLVLVVLVLAALGVWRYVRTRRARLDIRAAGLIELHKLRDTYNHDGDGHRLARDLSVLLRRLSLNAYPDAQVAGLINNDWLTFLDRHAGDDTPFSTGAGHALLDAPFRAASDFDADKLLAVCEHWVDALPKTPHRERSHA